MVRIALGIGVPLLYLLVACPVQASDTSSFPLGIAGKGKLCYFGECEEGAPPRAAGTSAPSAPQAPPAVQRRMPSLQQSALNFADELTNFGVSPQSALQTSLGTPTPTSVPGARVVTTLELLKALQSGGNFLLVDAWDDTQHETIPGAVRIPFAGRPGSFSDDTQRRLFQELAAETNSNPGYPIVFFCLGSRCWESYNATLRAQRMGFSNVFWYRGGIAAWRAARLSQSGSTLPAREASEPDTSLAVTSAPARSSTATLCGRSVDYSLDRSGSGSAFTGVWTGSWNNSSQMCGGLIVEKAQPGGSAQVIYVYGPTRPGSKFAWKQQHRTGFLSGSGKLSFEDGEGGSFAFNLADPDMVSAAFSNGSTRISGVFQKSR